MAKAFGREDEIEFAYGPLWTGSQHDTAVGCVTHSRRLMASFRRATGTSLRPPAAEQQ